MSARGVVSIFGLVLGIAYGGTIAQSGPPTNQIAVASRPDSPGSIEIEAADDLMFVQHLAFPEARDKAERFAKRTRIVASPDQALPRCA